MDIRHWDPSPATAARYRRPHLAGAAAIRNRADTAGLSTAPDTPELGRMPVARKTAGTASAVKPGLTGVAKVAVLGTPLPRPDGFAPPLTPLVTSRGPSHATSGGA